MEAHRRARKDSSQRNQLSTSQGNRRCCPERVRLLNEKHRFISTWPLLGSSDPELVFQRVGESVLLGSGWRFRWSFFAFRIANDTTVAIVVASASNERYF